jgi:hypothetical protein
LELFRASEVPAKVVLFRKQSERGSETRRDGALGVFGDVEMFVEVVGGEKVGGWSDREDKKPSDEWRVKKGSVQKCPGGRLSELGPSRQAPQTAPSLPCDYAQHCADPSSIFGLVKTPETSITVVIHFPKTTISLLKFCGGYARGILHMTPPCL